MSELNLFNMDCMELMAKYPDKHFDLAIVDPPYGIGVNHNMGRRRGDRHSDYKAADWDKTAPERSYFDELLRVSKNQVIWGANHFIDLIPYRSSCWIMWDKVFSEDVTFAQFELAWTSFTSTAKKFTLAAASQKERIHPTQKPAALYRWIIAKYAKEGDKILDTHLGSMSIALACHDMGFDLTGSEIDPDYFAAGLKRLADHKKQLSLFNPSPSY